MAKAKKNQASLPEGATIVNGTIIVDATKFEMFEVRARYGESPIEFQLRKIPQQVRGYYGITSA